MGFQFRSQFAVRWLLIRLTLSHFSARRRGAIRSMTVITCLTRLPICFAASGGFKEARPNNKYQGGPRLEPNHPRLPSRLSEQACVHNPPRVDIRIVFWAAPTSTHIIITTPTRAGLSGPWTARYLHTLHNYNNIIIPYNV